MADWTPERDALLRQWTAEGVTARDQAVRLGVSRNAILGRRFRLGIASPPHEPKPRLEPKPRAPKKAKPEPKGWTPERRAEQAERSRRMIAEGRVTLMPAKPLSVVLETFTRAHSGMSYAKAARSMGVSHQNLSARNWIGRYPDLWERSKALGAERKAMAHAWREAGKALAQEQKDAMMRAVWENNAVVLETMPERTQQIVHRRIEGHTLEQIGDDLGITRERVRQLQARAVSRGAIIPGVTLSASELARNTPKPPRERKPKRERKGWSEESKAAAAARMKARWESGAFPPEKRRGGRKLGSKANSPYRITDEERARRSDRMKQLWANAREKEKTDA